MADLIAKGFERRHAGAGQVRRATQLTGDHGVLRQPSRRIEPAKLVRGGHYGGEHVADADAVVRTEVSYGLKSDTRRPVSHINST